MKKLILAAMVAIAGWLTTQAQSMPAPERYNEFLEQMAKMDQKKAEFLMNATMETLSKDPKAYRQMMELAEKRFSDAADPIHNEGLYMAVLKHTTEKYILSGAEIEKQRLLLEGAKKNMIGSVAADFDYVTPDDKAVHHLKDLKANYILVYFNNPDCESCEKVKERLSTSELINKMVNDKKLIVLGVYPYDDQKLWKKAKYPKMMINGWNQSRQIEYAELYDLPTLPCFYLLGKDYKVLAKNEGSLNKIEALLNALTTASVAGPAPAPETGKPSKVIEGSPKRQSKQRPTIPGSEKVKNGNGEFDPAMQPAPKEKIRPVRPEPGPETPILAPADDPNTARSELLLNLMLNNQSQELYNYLDDNMKATTQPETFDGVITKAEGQLGKYQSHEPWKIQSLRGAKVYTSMMKFENSEAGLVIMYTPDGKVTGFSILPPQAIRH